MSGSRSLARGLLVACILVAALASPGLFSLAGSGPERQAEAQQPSVTGSATPSRSASPADLVALPGFTPADPFSAKLARLLSAPHQADANHIVISEFRWRGPDGPGDEFLELYNPTGVPVPIDGWELWRSNQCGIAGSLIHTFAVNTIVPAGGHYLIAGNGFSGDRDIKIALGVDNAGGIALFDGVSSLPVDAVGTEPNEDCPTSAAYHEGTHLDPLTANSKKSYERLWGREYGSCVDTDDNAADFVRRNSSNPQTSTDPATPCDVPPDTPTPSNTPPATATANCAARTPPAIYSQLSVMINEVGWSGTSASADDDWVELYNRDTACPIQLDGWHLESGGTTDFEVTFNSDDRIPAGGYFVVARDNGVFSDNVNIRKTLSGLKLTGSGEYLILRGPHNEFVDGANYLSRTTLWPAGSSSGARSMERYRITQDYRTSWVTYYRPSPLADPPRDRNGNVVLGSPGKRNWAFAVTVTPSPTSTRYSGKTATPRPPTPFAHMVINEFLPRAGTDWNQDGAVDVFDEFIEVKNLGPIDVDLANWKLDDEADIGSAAYTLPSLKLKPGDRAVFYGSTTRILLEDSGDSVRLINARGVLVDARGYGVVERGDESHCRLPDGYYWRLACFPTPGLENHQTGEAPAPPPVVVGERPPCLLADTVPEPFRQAECEGFGDEMYDAAYWDREELPRQFEVADGHSKWKTFVE